MQMTTRDFPTTETWLCCECGKPSTHGTTCQDCSERIADEFLATYERIKKDVENGNRS